MFRVVSVLDLQNTSGFVPTGCLSLQNLRRKAEQRNPDEFYFAMERKHTRGGVAAGR